MLRWVVVLMACSGIGNRLALADPLPDAVQRKVTRLELARSIRAFAAGTLANATCLIDKGELNRRQADAAMSFALSELGIHPAVLRNPQVEKAAELLKPQLDSGCGLSELDEATARQLIQDEL